MAIRFFVKVVVSMERRYDRILYRDIPGRPELISFAYKTRVNRSSVKELYVKRKV